MNSFGRFFRIQIFGESHGKMVGVIIDGCPAGIELAGKDFMEDLGRRKSGAKGTTSRKEEDIPVLATGVFNGHTTGAPITIYFQNRDTRSADYESLRETPRPGHADFTASEKFGGHEDFRGGGHFSGRLTTGIVAAGVVAKKIIQPVLVAAKLIEAGGSSNIEERINRAVNSGDSIGGIIEVRAQDIPVGLGEPFFDPVESLLSHIVFAIPAIKGIEFGSGFAAAGMKGSEHNDAIVDRSGKTETNHAGGINGGITNGNELVFRLAVKPTSSTPQLQKTMNMKTGKMVDLEIKGRHDACIALRVPVVAEAACSIVLADLMLLEHKRERVFKK